MRQSDIFAGRSVSPFPPDPAKVLDHCGWLSSQKLAVREAVRSAGRLVRFATRQTISFEGDADPRMFGIIKGFVGCYSSHRHAQPVLGTLLGPGDWFGVGPLINAGMRQLTYRAMQPVHALAINPPALAALRASCAEFDRSLTDLAESQVRYLTEVASELLIEDVANRITAVLLRLCSDQPATVTLPLVQAELGEMSNASRNSVSKLLRLLERQGLVRRGYGGIEVVDPAALARWHDAQIMRD